MESTILYTIAGLTVIVANYLGWLTYKTFRGGVIDRREVQVGFACLIVAALGILYTVDVKLNEVKATPVVKYETRTTGVDCAKPFPQSHQRPTARKP